MQTHISDKYRNTADGQEADQILRSCVHCGFCAATCPTYQLLNDELDSPRGRIYLIKQVLEGAPVSARTQLHLDRCLTCRACETTCPSGVKYGRLVDIGRNIVAQLVPRSPITRLQRHLLRRILPYAWRFRALLYLGRRLRPFLPATLRIKLPPVQKPGNWPTRSHQRKMLILQGCVQSVTTPNTNDAATRVLDKLGIQTLLAPSAGCCGAVSQHLDAPEHALTLIRKNIDAWWPLIEQGVEAIIVTASGCGVMVKEYAYLLRHDTAYAGKAARVTELTRDICEVLRPELSTRHKVNGSLPRVAFHSPCTLQHGLRLNGVVENILSDLGYTLVPVADAHLCCGSSGTYSLLQPELSQRLLANKVAALTQHQPQLIATANVGCQLHLAGDLDRPVRHWIELVESALMP